MPKDDKDGENHKDSPNAKRVGPYEKVSLATSKKLLEKLTLEFEKTKSFRKALETVSELEEAKQAVESTAEVVIRPRDFLELFSTEADLDGGFTDVSYFVRSSDRNADVQVFWRDLSRRSPDAEEGQPAREELCSIPVFELRKFVAGRARVFEWNPESRQWQSRRASEIQAGMTLLVPTDCGGYSDSLGWTGVATDRPSELPVLRPPADAFDADALSSAMSWLPLKDHLEDVRAEAEYLTEPLLDDDAIRQAITIAAYWHDVGKALDRWQQSALNTTSTEREKLQQALSDTQIAEHHPLLTTWETNWEPPDTNTLWAKFPNIRYTILNSGLDQQQQRRLLQRLSVSFQPGLRHEAASALAAWTAWQSGDQTLSALAVYLIACHHGKVRTMMRRTRRGNQVFGLVNSDHLQKIDDGFAFSHDLSFDCTQLGGSGVWDESQLTFTLSSPSWTQVIAELLQVPAATTGAMISTREPSGLGPIKLAYYEAIICAADIRASSQPGKGQHDA